jgi:hypothetical protein
MAVHMMGTSLALSLSLAHTHYSIQFNSIQFIFIYLRANLTAQRPITKLQILRHLDESGFTIFETPPRTSNRT